MISCQAIAAELRLGHPWTIRSFDEVGSTMTEISRAAEEGAPPFTVAVAESQTAGTGRHDRPWASAAGDGLWMTTLLRPSLPADRAPWFTLGAAVAVADGLLSLGFPVGIKWPNDVLVADGPLFRRKLCGIRAEMAVAEDGSLAWVSIGIGLNVHQAAFEGELASVAASLRMVAAAGGVEGAGDCAVSGEHSGAAFGNVATAGGCGAAGAGGAAGEPSRAQCAGAILNRLERVDRSFAEEGFGPVRSRWLDLALGLNREATVRDIEGEQTGIVRGMDEEGHLLLERPGDDAPFPIVAGDLVFAV